MNQSDHSIIQKMNIQSDAIVINQCSINKFEEFKYQDYSIRFISLAETGVGLSRNTALMRARADICLFADEDVEYVSGYKKLVLEAFESNPKADVIVFNVNSSTGSKRIFKENTKVKKLGFLNCMKYGTVRIAVKRESILKSNIFFSLLFGGGAKYSCGEDSLFLYECLKKGLKVYSNPGLIASVSDGESSWFKGYNEKYFFDKGVLFASISKPFCKLLCLQFVLRHGRIFSNDKTKFEAFKIMIRGCRSV